MDKIIILIIIMCICISISISIAGGIYFTQSKSPETTIPETKSKPIKQLIKPPPPPTTTTTAKPKILKRLPITTSAAAAGAGTGDSNFELVCPEGNFVNKFTTLWGSTLAYGSMRTDPIIDKIGITCSNNSVVTPQGGRGEGVGTAAYTTDVPSTTGFNKLGVKWGSYVDKVIFYPFNSSTGTEVGGSWGDKSASLSCGSEEKIMGVSINAGQYVDGINIICGKEQ